MFAANDLWWIYTIFHQANWRLAVLKKSWRATQYWRKQIFAICSNMSKSHILRRRTCTVLWMNECKIHCIVWVEYAAAASTWRGVIKNFETTPHTKAHKVQRKVLYTLHMKFRLRILMRCHRRHRHTTKLLNSFRVTADVWCSFFQHLCVYVRWNS